MKSAVYLWSIGECCCQGYPAIPAQGTIDDDSVNLGQIQWGTLPGHAHITGVVLPTEAALYYRARKAASCWELIKLYLCSVCVCVRGDMFSTIKKAMIKSAILAHLGHKACILSCQWEKFSYSLIYIFSVILFPFWVKKKQAFINCSVSGNRKPGNSSWIYMRFWLGCQVWFNSRRPFRDGPAMSTRDEMKPPVIKAMHILFTVVLLSWNSPLLAPLSGKTVWALCVSVCVWQGYAGTEESLGNSVLLISDMSDVARDNVIPSTTKLKAALRLLFSKQPAWVRPLGLCFVNVCVSECLCLFRCCNLIVSIMCGVFFM